MQIPGKYVFNSMVLALASIFVSAGIFGTYPGFPCHVSKMMLDEPTRTVGAIGICVSALMWMGHVGVSAVTFTHRCIDFCLKLLVCGLASVVVLWPSLPGTEIIHTTAATSMFLCFAAHLVFCEYLMPSEGRVFRSTAIGVALACTLLRGVLTVAFGVILQLQQPNPWIVDLLALYEAFQKARWAMRFWALIQWVNITALLYPLREYLCLEKKIA